MVTIDFRSMAIIDNGPTVKSFRFRLGQFVKGLTTINVRY